MSRIEIQFRKPIQICGDREIESKWKASTRNLGIGSERKKNKTIKDKTAVVNQDGGLRVKKVLE